MSPLIWLLALIFSLLVLVKSSDYFTQAAEKIGLSLKIPSFIIGVTIVSIGTSLPEFLTSIFAVLNNHSEIVIGDVIGSNITNIFLGLGMLPLIIGFFTINKNIVSVDLPILLGSTFLLAITCYDGIFTRWEAIFCLGGFFVYMRYAVKEHLEYKKKLEQEKITTPKINVWVVVSLVVSCIFLYFSAEYTVKSVIKIAQIINISTDIITASAVALGTSLPEIMTSIIAARKGNIEIAVGTLLGSNIFNAFAIMGITGMISDIIVPSMMTSYGIIMLILATLLYFFITLDHEITKFEGALLIIFYGLYLGKLFTIL